MATPNQKTAGKTIAGLRVVAKTAGFRRAGRAWSDKPTEVPVSEFKREQLAQLRADPGLIVIDTELAAPEAPADEK